MRQINMMKKGLLILVCFLILFSGIGIASAETQSGTLGSSNMVSINTDLGAAKYSANPSFLWLYFKDIQNAQGIKTVVGTRPDGEVYTMDAGAPSGAQTAVTIRKTNDVGPVFGTGVLAYQVIYNEAHTAIGGYYTFTIDDDVQFSQNIANLTGNVAFYLDYPKKNLYNISANLVVYSGVSTNCPSGGMAIYDNTGGLMVDRYLTNNYQQPTFADYSLTYPAGIGISGWINKTSGGHLYPSRAYVFNATNNALIVNDADTSTNNLFVNINPQPIKIGIKSGLGVWYNSSTMFTYANSPTVTPTPAQTIPAGYIRTGVSIIDQEGHRIQGANINIKDVEAGTWTNSTGDADGYSYIDTLPYHTINIYGSYTAIANQYLDNALLGQETGYNGGYSYYVTLFPYVSTASAGQTALYVEVKDAQTHSSIPYAVVEAAVTGGSTYVQSTGSSGIASFIVPNQTAIRLSASADGYSSASKIISSGTGSSISTSIDIGRQIVTASPTTTIPPGGITPARTLDTRSSGQKGQAGMDLLANNAESIIGFCIVLTILGFVKMMGK